MSHLSVHCPLLSLLPRDQRNNYKNNRHNDDNRDDRAEDAAALFLKHTGVGALVLSSGVRTSESTFPPSGREMAEVPSSPGMMSLIEGIPVSVAASELMVTKASSASAIESAVIILPLTVINLLVLSFICEILPLYIGVLFPTLFCHEKRILCTARNFI